jgi:hypothetical protein
VAWAGQERLRLGLCGPPPSTPELSAGEWLDLRPRWPLTTEMHPRCAQVVLKRLRKLPKPSRRPHESLTEITRRQLQGGEVLNVVRPAGQWDTRTVCTPADTRTVCTSEGMS